ncbi:MAG TPA: response regulator [Gemmatimonadaceae bacterium]|jgi:CheY-like chemotaxis protein
MKLLIVDDNPRMRATIRSVVTPAAAEVVECDNGLDAVALYDARRPDWVLMDISMPALDGIRATRRIRAINPDARVVIVTDFVDQAFRQAAARAGAVAFVTKDNLLELLRILE